MLSLNLFSQGVNNLWLMGYGNPSSTPWGGINLNFSTGTLSVNYQTRLMNFFTTNGVICDRQGNLLFASNGVFVMNAANDTMQNGNNLNPCFFTSYRASNDEGLNIPQANIIIPFPGDTTKYYLFHQSADDYGNTGCSFYLYYSIIDMTLDSGRGAVIIKNNILLNDSLDAGHMTACKHANGRDWWLIALQYNSNKYFKYLITPYGIQGPSTQNIGFNRTVDLGQVVFSPDGTKFASFTPNFNTWQGQLDIMDFDRCTGDFLLKAQITISDSAFAGGVSFSPNSQLLYLSSIFNVYQFDVSVADIASSQITVATWDGFYSPSPPFATYFYLSQLAPDGKIYIICYNGTLDFHVINNPNSLGIGCDVCQHCINLIRYNTQTIANHPNYFLGADTTSVVCDSLTGSIQFTFILNGSLNIYPNPANSNSEVTFTYPSSGAQRELLINDIDGKEVARYQLPQWSSLQKLKLPIMEAGVYIARLVYSNYSINTKFIIN